MGLLNDGHVTANTEGLEKKLLVEKLQQLLPQYKVYDPGWMIGNPICVAQSNANGVFITIKKDGFDLVQDAPSVLVRTLKAQFGLLGYALIKLFSKDSSNVKTLLADVTTALQKLS